MLIIDIGAVYIRCGIVLRDVEDSEIKNFLVKEIENNKGKLENLVEMSIKYKEKCLYFFKINLFKLNKKLSNEVNMTIKD